MGPALMENTTAGGQYWNRTDPSIDLSQYLELVAVLKIDSSNFLSNYARAGYYLNVEGSTSGYAIGLADSGFSLNSICAQNPLLTSYPVAGAYHTYRLVVQNGQGVFSIDGAAVASGISPVTCDGTHSHVMFGGEAGASRSVSELRYLCYSATPGGCTAPAAPGVAGSITIATDSTGYAQNATVKISGQLLDSNGNPLPNVSVGIQLTSGSINHTLSAVTNSAGSYSAAYQLLTSDVGAFTATASATYGNATVSGTASFQAFGAPGRCRAGICRRGTRSGLPARYTLFRMEG